MQSATNCAQIKAMEADIRTMERAIKTRGRSLNPVRIFKRGQLKGLVCEAGREGDTSNRDIAREVSTHMNWECTSAPVR